MQNMYGSPSDESVKRAKDDGEKRELDSISSSAASIVDPPLSRKKVNSQT